MCERLAEYQRVESRARHTPRHPCSVDGCEALTVGRGLCRLHYGRWYRRRTTEQLRPWSRLPHTCRVAGCDKPAFARERCRAHYDDDRRFLQVMAAIEAREDKLRTEGK